jgi:putative Ca2+/H+ antiporter (TMEM165/GDT1 family)
LEALLTTFVAAALAEWGDKTQLLVIALAARYGKAVPILLGVAVAALANSLIAAAGGILVNGYIVLRAISLLIAVALIFAGVAGLIGGKAPEAGSGWGRGPFLAAAGGFFILEFGDKTQFLTFALAARFDTLPLAAAGATAGILVSCAPAAVLGHELGRHVPLKAVRIGVGILFLLVAFFVAINALQLV